MRLLIIEDDQIILELLSTCFKASSFAVDATDCGERGSYLGRVNDYDLVILDYHLPKKDGQTICKELRSHGKTMPIIMVSVRSAIPEKVDMFDSGIDDYVTKPFSLQELKARVTALLRRPRAIEQDVITVANITINVNRQTVLCDKQKIYLTRKEFALLEYLARNRGLVMSRGMLLEHVWDSESNPFSNTIEAHILNLRKKLGTRGKQLIRTIPGRGYILDIVR